MPCAMTDYERQCKVSAQSALEVMTKSSMFRFQFLPGVTSFMQPCSPVLSLGKSGNWGILGPQAPSLPALRPFTFDHFIV